MNAPFTTEERRGIARTLANAKKVLWSGEGQWGHSCAGGMAVEKYICNCIDKVNRWNVLEEDFRHGALAKFVIQERLGDCHTLEGWLKQQGISSSMRDGYSNSKKMQAHRLAWLDLLIVEFSK